MRFLDNKVERIRIILFTVILLFSRAPICQASEVTSCFGEQGNAEVTRQLVENEWPLRGSGDGVSSYVQSLGIRLTHGLIKQSPSVDWHFFVVRDHAINGFSIGGGYVFVTDGAVSFVQNESELAGILAHEIGHEEAGHFCHPMPAPSLFSDLFAIPDTNGKIMNRGIGSLSMVFDLTRERQADEVALKILETSGFDPRSMLTLARRLSPNNPYSHMVDSQRVRSLEKILAKIPVKKVEDSKDFRIAQQILRNEQATW